MILKPMSINYCTYSNFHNDPNPVLFVMHSDSKYTEGLNIRYLSIARRFAFFAMIRKLQGVGAMKNRPSGQRSRVYNTIAYNGKMMYAIIKKYYPDFAKVAYRKYFTVYITGVLINDSLNAGTPLIDIYLRTQSNVMQATSNFMETRAKNDMVVREVNKVLARTRVESMRNYENLNRTLFPQPGPAVTSLPGQANPQNTPVEQVRNQADPSTPQQTEQQNARNFGEDVTPGEEEGEQS